MNDKKKTETDSDLQDKNTVDKNIPNKAPQHNKPDSTRPDKNPGHCKSKELMTVCPKVTVTPQETVNKKTQIRPPEDPSKTVAYTGKNTPCKLLTRARPDRNLTGKVAEIKRQFRDRLTAPNQPVAGPSATRKLTVGKTKAETVAESDSCIVRKKSMAGREEKKSRSLGIKTPLTGTFQTNKIIRISAHNKLGQGGHWQGPEPVLGSLTASLGDGEADQEVAQPDLQKPNLQTGHTARLSTVAAATPTLTASQKLPSGKTGFGIVGNSI